MWGRAVSMQTPEYSRKVGTPGSDGAVPAGPARRGERAPRHRTAPSSVRPPDRVRTVAPESAVRPGGRVVVFDKFLPDGAQASLPRRALNLLTTVLATDINRRLADIMAGTALVKLYDEPVLWGDTFRVAGFEKHLQLSPMAGADVREPARAPDSGRDLPPGAED